MKIRSLFLSAVVVAAGSTLLATYAYYYTDSLTTITTNWTENGTLSAGAGGLTSSNSNGGSLISTVTVPDGTSNYEVKTTLTLAYSGGTYVTYLRASSNAMSGPAAAGTTYAFEVQNPTFSGSGCTATLAGYSIISGVVTLLSSTGIVCNTGMTVRSVITPNNQIVVYINNSEVLFVRNTAISSGQPGIGVRGAPSGNSISQVQLGAIYTGAPTMPPASEIGVSAYAADVQIQWPGASEAAAGPGVAFYNIYRNGTILADVGLAGTNQGFIDAGVSHSTTYTYSIVAVDYDLNSSTDTIMVTTPPAGSADPRETGVRPNGSYWGGGGEQIDMLSGNLNYTMPIVKAMGRGGWSVGFNLTYNSQNWRQDPGGTWQLGDDVGYGYGWKLLAGSLLPFNTPTGVAEYIYTDGTGAQYHLDQNSGGVWTSKGIFVSYDATNTTLYFNDGSFWFMGATSAGTEWDAGTMYPTSMEDSNGNEILITYNDGVGVTWPNSSSRINTIEDVRGDGAKDYSFSYNSDSIPHLTGIVNLIATSENYSFTYAENYALNSPFNGQNVSTVALLQSSSGTSIPYIPLTTYFTYDTTSSTASCTSPGTGTTGPGLLTQVTTPYCGHLRWTYTTANTLSGSRTYNEVQNRYLSMYSSAAETEITLVRANDTAYTVHSTATLQDSSANAEKIWTFQTNSAQFNLGLQLTYEEATLSPLTPLSLLTYTWQQTPTTLNSYIGTTVTQLSPGATYEADKQTIQTLDQYGNLLTMQVYNFGTGAGNIGSLARTYTNTYLGGSNYTSLYIVNRLLTSTVTDGTNTATLVTNTYDTTMTGTDSTYTCNPAGYGPYLCEHDSTYYPYTFTTRGNVSTSTTPTTYTTNSYDLTGTVLTTTVNGVTSTVTPTNNFAAPGQITTNLLNSSMNWSAFLGLSSATGPNGDTGSILYDANARPSSTTSPYGAVTTNTYNDTASPPNKIAVTCPSPGSCTGSVVKTVMDGFGRTLQTVNGYGTATAITTVSTVDTQYAPCGCSPLGKLSQQSQPYAPGGTDAWTKYTYDASGRTLSVTLPDGPPSSTTTYVYQGNTVTVTDPAGKWKTFTMDALGNLTAVLEPDPSPLGNVTTSYTYDVLNHLAVVSMPRGTTTQTRTFNYNSGTTVTGFLQSATNPENGTVIYTYTPGTNTLFTKTDAKNQKLTYMYDSYNRLTSVTASGQFIGNNVVRTYSYDTNTLNPTFSQNSLGRLTAVQYLAQSSVQMNEMYSYTLAGLPSIKRLQVNEPGTAGTMTVNLDSSYMYNNEGEVISLTYPNSGASYNYSYDNMYRLNGMTTSSGTTVVNGVTYNPANQMLSMYYGVSESRSYNVLNQLTNISTSAPPYPAQNLTYNYPTGTNNGKISSMYNAISGETISYSYDSLNRISTASDCTVPSGCTQQTLQWAELYGFDSFGNLLSKALTAGLGAPNGSQSVNAANNQLVDNPYDANGNVTAIYNGNLTNNLTYDAENRMSSVYVSSVQFVDYAYDAQNRRIWSWSGATDANGRPSQYIVNCYSPTGQKLAGYTLVSNGSALSVTLKTSDSYFGSRRLAELDQLGSAGNQSGELGTYYPWGEPKGSTNPQDAWSYATYWQDSFSGLDYASNRYYSNIGGRFMTPDPYTNSGRLSDPQSWNRYAYTRGDPVNRYDPSGMDDFSGPYPCTVGAGEGTEVVDCFSVTVSIPGGFNPAAAAQYALALPAIAAANAAVNQAINTMARIQAGVAAAIKALNSENCERLFNLDPNAPDPAILLSQIANNQNDSVYFTESYFPNTGNLATNAVTQKTAFSMQNGSLVNVGYGGTNYLVAFNVNPSAPFNSGSVNSDAVTILHELGHIYEDLYGLGSTLLIDDSNGNTAASQYNTALVSKNCFPGGT
jgi:RHS repeat-associated protein